MCKINTSTFYRKNHLRLHLCPSKIFSLISFHSHSLALLSRSLSPNQLLKKSRSDIVTPTKSTAWLNDIVSLFNFLSLSLCNLLVFFFLLQILIEFYFFVYLDLLRFSHLFHCHLHRVVLFNVSGYIYIYIYIYLGVEKIKDKVNKFFFFLFVTSCTPYTVHRVLVFFL